MDQIVDGGWSRGSGREASSEVPSSPPTTLALPRTSTNSTETGPSLVWSRPVIYPAGHLTCDARISPGPPSTSNVAGRARSSAVGDLHRPIAHAQPSRRSALGFDRTMASPTPASPPQKTATRSVLSFLLASPLVLALLIRLPLALIQRTPFQPDETYQSLEPAHRIVFGYGHLTWEWQPNEAVDRVWWGWMAEGRLRGSGWVGVWVVVYSAVKAMGIESWALVSNLTRLPIVRA